MALLEQLHTKRAVSLSSRHIVGRSRACQLQLQSSTVSGAHALVEWSSAAGWTVRDLGSKNGTFVDGRRLSAESVTPILEGARIAFGGESEVWRLIDPSAPGPVARAADGECRAPELGMIALPGVDHPEVTVFIEDGRCFVDADSGRAELGDGARLTAGGAVWTLLVPELLSETVQATTDPSLRELELAFVVSRDEENVELRVSGGGLDARVPHRSHNYMLLTLARLRIEDAKAAELPPGEQGWIDSHSLKDMLRVDPELLNLLVFRARRQLAELRVRDAPALVERRPGSRQLRIGTDRVTVTRA